jgi:hypothetical protein
MHEISPTMIRIIGTEIIRPKGALDTFNDYADGYFVNPVEPSRLITLIEEKLEDQKDAKITQAKKQRVHIGSETNKLL